MEHKLITEIIKRSESKIWDIAKEEWCFESIYQRENSTCLCGHHPIKNICIIHNHINNNITEVGNCCVNKFLDIDIGTKILSSIKLLQKDISKSINTQVLDFINKKKILSEWDYKFYSDIRKTRNLTEKQKNYKIRINKKFLNTMSSEESPSLTKINLILEWAENHTFDTSFVLSLYEQYKQKGELSPKQIESLERIINNCKIPFDSKE